MCDVSALSVGCRACMCDGSALSVGCRGIVIVRRPMGG